MRTAAIVGAGVVGSMCALALQREGFAVTLIDPMREPSGASWGNAGHIATEQVEPLASWKTLRSAPRRLFALGGALDFRLSDIDRWLPFGLRFIEAASASRFARGKAALTQLLSQAGEAWQRATDDLGAAGLYRPIGHVVVWERAQSADVGLAAWHAAGTGRAQFRPVREDELAPLAAAMRTRPAGAVRFSGTGQISDPTALAETMERAFVARGGTRRYDHVQSLAVSGGRARIRLSSETIEADVALIAAGIRSADFMRAAGLTAPLIAERGYHIQTNVDARWPADLGPVVFEDRAMVVTRFQTALRATSFLEFGRADAPPDPRKWARLRAHIAELGLPFALPGTEWMGCRPTLPDYLPAIGRAANARNLLYAFGHQHLGLTLAPITAEIVARLATESVPPIDVTPFGLERFS